MRDVEGDVPYNSDVLCGMSKAPSPTDNRTYLRQLNPEKLGQREQIQLGTYNTETTDNCGSSASYVGLAGNVVKVDPLTTFGSSHDALGAKDNAVLVLVCQFSQLSGHACLVELNNSLGTATDKHLIGVVMMVVVVMVMTTGTFAVMMVVLMVVTMTLFIVIVVMMLMVVLVTMALLVVIVMMLMIMLVAMAFLIVIVVVLMVMLVAMAFLIMIVVVMMVVRFLGQSFQLSLQGILSLHGGKEISALQLIPGSGDENSGLVVSGQACHGIGHLFLGELVRVGQDDTAGIGHLIVKELTEVLHIHLALARIHYGGEAIENCPFGGGILHGTDDVGQLTYARGLDENAVGVILSQHLGEGLAEVAHQGATDTA